MVLIHVIACVLAADFLSGLLHWLEDAYGREHWPITGKLITRPNILHHHDPAYFTRHGWFESAQVLLVIGLAVLLGAWALDLVSWEIILVVAIGVNANEIHKWTHQSRRKNGRLVSWLQDLGVLQSAEHHANHHRGEKSTHYCVVTNYLNPLLERVGLWPSLERLILLVCRVQRRVDLSVHGSGRYGAPGDAISPVEKR